jgi:hypothetical protein
MPARRWRRLWPALPTAQQILSLIALTLVPPEQHGSSTFWGVLQPPGAKQMPETIKLSIF